MKIEFEFGEIRDIIEMLDKGFESMRVIAELEKLKNRIKKLEKVKVKKESK